jgi:hypothetical protein
MEEVWANRQKICEDITNTFDKKTKQYMTQDLVSFTVLCLMKKNRRKFQISQEKQA